jgi:hypothetical protein
VAVPLFEISLHHLDLSAAARETTGAAPAGEPSSAAVEEAPSKTAALNSGLWASDVPRSSSAGYTTALEDRLRSAEGSSLAEVVGSHPGAGSTPDPQAVSRSGSPLGATNWHHPTGKCYRDPAAVQARGKCRSKLRAIPALCPGQQ